MSSHPEWQSWLTSYCLCNPTPLSHLTRFLLPLHLLSAHYSSFICLSLLCSIPSPCSHFSSSSSSHFHLSPSSFFVVIIISVIALPLPGGGVFTAASLSNLLMLDYCCMITATIPWWSLLHFARQCSTADRDALSNLDPSKIWEEISPCKTHTSVFLLLFFVSTEHCNSVLMLLLQQWHPHHHHHHHYQHQFMFLPVISLPSHQPFWTFWRVWIRSDAFTPLSLPQ